MAKPWSVCSKYKADHSFRILSNPGFLAEGVAMKDLCNAALKAQQTFVQLRGAAPAGVLADIYANWAPLERNLEVWP